MIMVPRKSQELHLAAFHLGASWFAVDIMRIREIVPAQRHAGVPLHGTAFDGMINLRGQVIPLVSLRVFFGMPEQTEQQGKLMIVSVAGRLVALAVDDLDDVFTVTDQQLVAPPDVVDSRRPDYLIAVVAVHDRLYQVLNIDEMVAFSDRYFTAGTDRNRL